MCISAANSSRLAASFVPALLLLTGCTVGPDFTRPPAPPDSQYTSGPEPAGAAGGLGQKIDTGALLPNDWWKLLGNSALNDAVAQGLSQSPTIAGATARLKEAQDELRSGQGIFYPQLGASASASREHPSQNATPLHFREGTYNLFTAAATVSYVLDIFGGERRQVEALGAGVDYQENAARAASLTLAANIANAFIALAAYRAQVEATGEIASLQRRQVELARVQAEAGTGTYAAELSLESQLEATEAAIPALEQRISQTLHLIAVLEGKPPSQLSAPAPKFEDLSLPATLPLSLPSSLVRQRPDILEAEALLHAASARIGVATAAMLPNITLGGSAGYSATDTASLFAGPSNLWSIGAGLAQPLFQGGTLYYQRKAAIDAYDAASADYRQAVLSAFQQVADTLRGLQHDAQSVAADERAVKTARRALDLVQANYGAGLATYSDVLLANAQYGQARIALIQSQATRYQDTVALFAALGGGWWNDPATPSAIAASTPSSR